MDELIRAALTQQVLHALCWLDDLSAHGGAADTIKGVVGCGDHLQSERQKKQEEVEVAHVQRCWQNEK